MKIIEALKKIKGHCAHPNYENPVYPDQMAQVKEWIQSHTDSVKEIARLKVAIQRTNIQTQVTIELESQQVSKSIAEWIHWRRGLATMQHQLYNCLTDRNLKEGRITGTQGAEIDVKIVRYYDPKERDAKLELYRSEPSKIDSTLEVINATTDLIE